MTGIDGSASSLSALRWAVHLAKHTGAAVDVVAAWHYPVAAYGYDWAPAGIGPEYDFEEIAQEIVADAIDAVLGPGSKVGARACVVEGEPARVLLDASDGADLLVVGNRGHGGSAESMLGSVSQHCVHHACCPVVVIRGGDHGRDADPPRTAPSGDPGRGLILGPAAAVGRASAGSWCSGSDRRP